MTNNPGRIRFVFSAEVEMIDVLCEEAKRFFSSMNIVKSFELLLPLREALLNAVIHGSNNNPQKKVFCELYFDGFDITMKIRDEGDGFDWSQTALTKADIKDLSGRGISIMEHYSNRVEYNKSGNEIVLTKNILSLTGIN